MKNILILAFVLCGSAWAAEKKTDMRQGTKAVDESRKTISHDVHANQNRAQQIESKKSRQHQEEQLEKLEDQR